MTMREMMFERLKGLMESTTDSGDKLAIAWAIEQIQERNPLQEYKPPVTGYKRREPQSSQSSARLRVLEAINATTGEFTITQIVELSGASKALVQTIAVALVESGKLIRVNHPEWVRLFLYRKVDGEAISTTT